MSVPGHFTAPSTTVERMPHVPGRHVTDHQMRLFVHLRHTEGVSIASAKAGFSAATGHRLAAGAVLPSGRKAPRERRWPDPLADIFDAEIVPLLEAAPALRAIAIYEEMRRCHPDLPSGIRRTIRTTRPRMARRGGLPSVWMLPINRTCADHQS
ncbi:hypothetical protein QH494_22495 [Sphingomonas sp. AR_OL41]|uniref:hypothetical protein n=1 Tax=Sphingomonas sp. AR_OL41 TaxID=3042729 RepID=UPI0024801214|nr:hypothetical protein [Sphingomonas sp. AR_OL41]MDH7974964.1 hypothetical protein [Sphingomonas sp. AR_OL41]